MVLKIVDDIFDITLSERIPYEHSITLSRLATILVRRSQFARLIRSTATTILQIDG